MSGGQPRRPRMAVPEGTSVDLRVRFVLGVGAVVLAVPARRLVPYVRP